MGAGIIWAAGAARSGWKASVPRESVKHGRRWKTAMVYLLIALALWLAARAMDKAARIDAGEDDDEEDDGDE